MPNASARSVACRATEVTVQWDGRTALVTARGKAMARVTPTSRSVSRSCAPIADLPLERRGLETSATGRARVACRPGPYIRIDVEPVRSSSGRIVGSRLAVFVSGWRVESAEALITRRTKWFSWSPIACHGA